MSPNIDNVLAYQIVLASGAILNVSQTSYPDLFHSLKGGSGNFGIVTSFTLRTFALGGLWGGDIYYPGDATVDSQMKAFSKSTKARSRLSELSIPVLKNRIDSFAANPKYDVNAVLQMTISYAPSVGVLFVDEPLYALPQANPAALQPFTSIQPQYQDGTGFTTLSDFATASAALSPRGSRQMTWSISVQNDLQLLHAIYNAFNNSIPSIANVSGISWSITLEPLPKAFLDASTKLGGNVLGLPSNPKGNSLFLIDSSFTWSNDADTTTVRKAGLKLLNDIAASAKKLGAENQWVDVNHADYTQDPISSFGLVNKGYLGVESLLYDPLQVFQKQVPGGFKIFP